MGGAKGLLADLLSEAGLTVDGPEPWDPQVHDDRFYPRVLKHKNLGLGEAYMEGWWECSELDEFFRRLLLARLDRRIRASPRTWPTLLAAMATNRQSRRRSLGVAERHYNLDPDLFSSFLDENMQYSCGCFENGCTLDEAQERKIEMTLAKLDVREGERLLDIGSGWGGLARFAARERGARVTGVNIASEQVAHARGLCAGLDVEFVQQDYRDLEGTYDKIVSVGMFEHVGRRNHRAFFETCERCLAPGGRVLLHTIGANEASTGCDPWIDRYIFPGGELPVVEDIGRASRGLFVMEDWHNLGPNYAETLAHWNANFQRAWAEDGLAQRRGGRYGERFRRMWEYYLLSCRGAFLARDIQVWQIVFTRPGTEQPCCRL